MAFLIFGNGWISSLVANILKDDGKTYYISNSRIENRTDILSDIERYNPKYIINCAGKVRKNIKVQLIISKTGIPNVDWCEENKQETIRYDS